MPGILPRPLDCRSLRVVCSRFDPTPSMNTRGRNQAIGSPLSLYVEFPTNVEGLAYPYPPSILRLMYRGRSHIGIYGLNIL